MTVRMLESLTKLGSSQVIFMVRGWLGSFIWIVLAHFVFEMNILKTKLNSYGRNFEIVKDDIRLKQRFRILCTILIMAYETIVDIRTVVAWKNLQYLKDHISLFKNTILVATIVRILIDLYLYLTLANVLIFYVKSKKHSLK
jgi:hypothetical protein